MFGRRLVFSAIGLLSAVSRTSASTRVIVLEFGKGGVVHRTNSGRSRTSVPAVESFWSSLHVDDADGGLNSRAQHPGMSLVPDFFHRPHGGLVIGLTGVDLDEMKALQSYLRSNNVGEFTLPGSQSTALLKCDDEGATNVVKPVDEFSSLLDESIDVILSGYHRLWRLSSLPSKGDSRTDQVLSSALMRLENSANENDYTLVVHLVLEEDKEVARLHKIAHKSQRRLEDEDRDNEEDGEEDEKDDDEDEKDDDGNNNGNGGGYYGSNSLFYGFSYTLSNGNSYTPWRTIYQIQYFNIVVWSSLGLVAVTVFSMYLLMGMPLMPDSLLFGESAKLMGTH